MHKYNLDNLKPFRSKWQNSKTKLIRVPEIFEDEILTYAHQLDSGINNPNSLVTEKLKEIVNKIDNQESGYKVKYANNLIKDIKQLVNEGKNNG
ncbi:hypothetical protein ACN4EE_05510 [Geminocystis sp. CENA526]|uniref:hypothetical protein n=1 Tax=Geminocystis sp. CENA526 TaxID=1355871 RepID=UPI003D6F6EA6